MRRKRPGILAVKKHVVKELIRDPYWRERLDNVRSTAEAIQIIRDFGKAKGYSTDADESWDIGSIGFADRELASSARLSFR